MQDILIVEEVDVRRADDPNDSRVLTITKVGLPKLVRKSTEHTPGGGVGSVAFVLPMLNAFEPTFSVKGIDIQLVQEFGFVPGAFDKWTFAASLRNTLENKIMPVRFNIRGTVSEWSPGEHTPGELFDCDMTMREVTAVDLYIDEKKIFEWDFKARIGWSGGRDWFEPYRKALGV